MKNANQKINLKKYFKYKSQADLEFERVSKQIYDLIPSELTSFRSERFYDFTNFMRQLTSCEIYLHDKIKSPEDYGFTSMDDAVKKLKLLKKAWKGIIDVKINKPTNYGDYYVAIYFNLVIF